MEYFIKSSAVIIIFYTLYKLILQKETFFSLNRFFLISGLLISIIIPSIVIPIYIETSTVEIGTIITENNLNTPIAESPINWTKIIFITYFTGIAFFLGKFLINVISVLKVIKSGEKEHKRNFTYVKTDKEITPFSFFNYIVFNPKKFKQEDLEQIITHEKIHVKQLHSIDLFISQLFTIVFWANPFVWFYKKEIEQNLEFIADEATQNQVKCEKTYQKLLLKNSIPKNQLALTNNFYNSLIKKRIVMLHKNRSKSQNQWKYAIIVPILTAFVFMFNTKVVAQETAIITEELKTNDGRKVMFTVNKNSTDEQIDEIKRMLNANNIKVKFSKTKRNSNGEITQIAINLSGKNSNASYSMSSDDPIKPIIFTSDENGEDISIQNTRIDNKKSFIINKNGKSIHIDSDEDNIIISDKKSNGYVYEVVEEENGNNGRIIVTGTSNTDTKDVLYIVDGKKISMKKLEEIDANSIKEIKVLKGEKAVKKYGEKAKNGVVEVTTKK